LARSPRLADLTRPAGAALSSGERSLHALKGDALKTSAVRLVCTEVARVLRVPVETLDATANLQEAGIDSLSSFELRNRIGQAANVELPLAQFSRARRIADVADLVCTLVGERVDAAKDPAKVGDPRLNLAGEAPAPDNRPVDPS
jgi:acyl carrier protein